MAWEMNPNSVPQALSLKHLLSTHLFTSTQMPLLQKQNNGKTMVKKKKNTTTKLSVYETKKTTEFFRGIPVINNMSYRL